MFWELPPRHSGDRADMRDKLSDVNPEYWGEEHWRNGNIEHMAPINCVNDRRMPENQGMCAMCPSLKLLDIATWNE